MSYGGAIRLLPNMEPAEEFSTLVHKLAHEMIHKSERRTTITKTAKVTVAEAIAFVVSRAIGLETRSASADYIQLYHGNAELLCRSRTKLVEALSAFVSIQQTVQILGTMARQQALFLRIASLSQPCLHHLQARP